MTLINITSCACVLYTFLTNLQNGVKENNFLFIKYCQILGKFCKILPFSPNILLRGGVTSYTCSINDERGGRHIIEPRNLEGVREVSTKQGISGACSEKDLSVIICLRGSSNINLVIF